MPFCIEFLPIPSPHQTLTPNLSNSPSGPSLSAPRNLDPCKKRCADVCRSLMEQGFGMRLRKRGREVFSSGNGMNSSGGAAWDGCAKKRSIVEHIFLLHAKEKLSEAEEKDMLDHLYTSQYQMGGIIAISLGRIADPNVDNFTHAVYMRFQKKEDISKFYANPYYSGILKGHVIPYCYVCTNMARLLWIMYLQ